MSGRYDALSTGGTWEKGENGKVVDIVKIVKRSIGQDQSARNKRRRQRENEQAA